MPLLMLRVAAGSLAYPKLEKDISPSTGQRQWAIGTLPSL